MIPLLHQTERHLKELVLRSDMHTMYIDYHKPYVSRIWFQMEAYRVYLHRIEPCGESAEALYHPHPWKSVIRILSGTYEMGVGHSATDDIPVTDCTLILSAGTVYEMTEENAWHYVNPLEKPVYSLMITGELNRRKMPAEPRKSFRPLITEEKQELFSVFNAYYGWGLTPHQLEDITWNAV